MKNLRLTILLESDLSKAELKNSFGEFKEIVMPHNRYLQFTFPSVRMLTRMQLDPICKLVKTYEDTHKPLYFKMFHLFDDSDESYSPIAVQCRRNSWFTVSSSTGEDMNSSPSINGLF